MHLTAEEKAVGRENFNTVIGTTRRDFLKQGICAGVVSGGGLGAMYFGYGKSVDNPVRVGIVGSGDEGNVLIGAINPDYIQVVAVADIRPYNIHRTFHGDWSSPGTLKVRPGLISKYGWSSETEARKHVKVYDDKYEDLLDDDDVEAVIIALPLHLHDEAAIKAMRKDKHVLTEKLMAHSVHQCKEMSRVADDTGLYLATGHQRHYSILYDNAVDTIKTGLLGDIHHIRAQWHRGNLPRSDSWQQPLPPPKDYGIKDFERDLNELKIAVKQDPENQEKLDDFLFQQKLLGELRSWENKLKTTTGKERLEWENKVAQKRKQIEDNTVNAEDYGYRTITLQDGKGTTRSALEELIRWRLWNRTGGGLMAELGSHQLDAASIFISSQRNDGKKVLPLSVTAVGGRHIFPHDRQVDDHVYCTYEFPAKGYFKDGDFDSGEVADDNKKICVTYSSINGNGFGGYGEIVMGTKGTMILEAEKEVMLFGGGGTSTKVKVQTGSGGPTLDTTASGGADMAIGELATTGEISRGYTEEIEHWAWCIRNQSQENQPKCHPQIALADAVIALTTNIAIAEKKPIEFKREWFDIDSDETPEGVTPKQAKDLA